MNKLILIIFVILYCSGTSLVLAQSKEDTVYIYFDHLSNEKISTWMNPAGDTLINKYRKSIKNELINFVIGGELFISSKKSIIDTVSSDTLKKIDIRDLKFLFRKREKFKDVYFFKKDVFDKIYLLERINDKVVVYDVTWATDIISH